MTNVSIHGPRSPQPAPLPSLEQLNESLPSRPMEHPSSARPSLNPQPRGVRSKTKRSSSPSLDPPPRGEAEKRQRCLRESARRKRVFATRVAYIGSADDVKPVLAMPDADFVFLTPEPAHPVAVEHWDNGCRGYRWLVAGGAPLFLDVIHGCLGREHWKMEHKGENKVFFQKKSSGQRITLFMNMTVEDHTLEAAKAVASCHSYIRGFDPSSSPTKEALAKLVRGLRHADELSNHEGSFQPVDGLDSPVTIGSEWHFVKYDFDSESSESDEESGDSDSDETHEQD